MRVVFIYEHKRVGSGVYIMHNIAIEGVLLGIGMQGDEGLYLRAEAADAVGRDHSQVLRLLVIGRHLRIIKSVLRARKA